MTASTYSHFSTNQRLYKEQNKMLCMMTNSVAIRAGVYFPIYEVLITYQKMAELTPREGLFEICNYGKLRGRGLRALKSSKPGDNILESTPVVFVLSNNVRGQCCDMCFTQGGDLQRCSKCKFARYCDRQCQKKDWKEHKIECERILRVSPNVPTDLVRLMARIMQKKHSDAALCKYLSQLVSHHEQLGELRRDAFTTIITVLKHFVGGKDFQKFSTAELFELFGKISCNCFTMCGAELQPLGEHILRTKYSYRTTV